MERKPLRLAVIGGGIGGLTFPICLDTLIPNCGSHFKVDLYEAQSTVKAQIGAGMGVWPMIWGVFQEIGIEEDVLKLSLLPQTDDPVEMMLVRKADEKPAKDLYNLTSDNGRIIQFHRGDFQTVLADHLPSWVNVHVHKRLRSYTQNDSGVVLEFEDGATAEADVVIGADGLQSNVRRKLVEEAKAVGRIAKDKHPEIPRWTGCIAYRDLIPKEKFLEQGQGNHRALTSFTLHTGKGGSMLTFPISDGDHINFIAMRLFPEYENTEYRDDVMADILRAEGFERPGEPTDTKVQTHKNVNSDNVWSSEGGENAGGKRHRWFTQVTNEEVRQSFADFEPEIQVLMNGLVSPLAWAIHAVKDLDTFSHGRVCLLGDSAHAMHPHHGTGAAMAMSDAYVLAHLFAGAVASDHTKLSSNADKVLDVYDRIRRPDVQEVAEAARAGSFHYATHVSEGDGKWRLIDPNSEEDVKRLQEEMTRVWSYVWDKQRLPKSVNRGLRMLQEIY